MLSQWQRTTLPLRYLLILSRGTIQTWSMRQGCFLFNVSLSGYWCLVLCSFFIAEGQRLLEQTFRVCLRLPKHGGDVSFQLSFSRSFLSSVSTGSHVGPWGGSTFNNISQVVWRIRPVFPPVSWKQPQISRRCSQGMLGSTLWVACFRGVLCYAMVFNICMRVIHISHFLSDLITIVMQCQTTIVAFNWVQCALLGRMLWGNCAGEFVGIHGIRLLATLSASAILLCIWPGSVCAERDHRPEKLKVPTHETTHRHLIKHLTFHLWGASIEYARTHSITLSYREILFP